MNTSPCGLRMGRLGPLCCVVLALLLATPSTVFATTIYVTTLLGANEVPPTGFPGPPAALLLLGWTTLIAVARRRANLIR